MFGFLKNIFTRRKKSEIKPINEWESYTTQPTHVPETALNPIFDELIKLEIPEEIITRKEATKEYEQLLNDRFTEAMPNVVREKRIEFLYNQLFGKGTLNEILKE